jgi:hypothetical protein
MAILSRPSLRNTRVAIRSFGSTLARHAFVVIALVNSMTGEVFAGPEPRGHKRSCDRAGLRLLRAQDYLNRKAGNELTWV